MAGVGTGPGGSGAPEPLESQSRDFAAIRTSSGSQQPSVASTPVDASELPEGAPSPHVRYALNIDTTVGNTLKPDDAEDDAATATGAADGGVRLSRQQSPSFTPISRRRTARVGTFKTVDDFNDFEVRPGWHPGAEPGLDPSKPDGGHASMPTLNAPCDITVVDFSQDQFSIQRLDNETLEPFLQLAQPKWAKCRWINVNGLSWDVIQALGRHKNLHKLALEDIMNTRNRTKAEWYPTHAFLILTLQKLVRLCDSENEDDDDSDAVSRVSGRSWSDNRSLSTRLEKVLRRKKRPGHPELEKGVTGYPAGFQGGPIRSQPTGLSDSSDLSQLRTLQRYHAAPNDPRTQFMERHSALNSRDLAVACEQVAMFITHDNTIISFFELSAEDVEDPIVRRLQVNDTTLHESCDAFMVAQAIIDAIIDLAIPVTAVYGEVIGDLELDVLTEPNINHTKSLYVVITEINKMLSFINPITTLIQALRDHKSDITPQEAAALDLQDPSHGVIITPVTHTYLGDVLDHCVLISESLVQLKSSAEGMIDLIFNTISAHQNESMKQLTVATIIFLPLTFLTGYYGQNFENFTDLTLGVSHFWKIAVPVVCATIIILLRHAIFDYVRTLFRRSYVSRLRRHRRLRRESARRTL